MPSKNLAISINHIAALRQLRHGARPDPVEAALAAERGGAAAIVAHLRQDRTHVQERDLRLLRHTLEAELHVELTTVQDSLKIAYDIRPNTVILVPEFVDDTTAEGGLDVARHKDQLRQYVRGLKEADIRTGVFVDPNIDQIRAAHRIEADILTLHTGKYADAGSELDRKTELQRLVDAARTASKLGLRINLANRLSYQNVQPLTAIAEIDMFTIGHAVVARAVSCGMEQAVRDMRSLLLC